MNKLHLTIIFLLISLASFAQKKGMNYQAVIIDPKAIDIPGVAITGQPYVNSNVCVKFGILSGNVIEFEEVQRSKTDDFGLVNLTIGSGTKTSLSTKYPTFESIIWDSKIKALQVSISFDDCATFQQVSIQNFNYTPYAFYAGSVDYKNVIDAPKDLSYFGNDVGYLVDKDLDPLRKNLNQNAIDIANLKQETTDKFAVVNQSIVDLEKRVTTNENDIESLKTKNAEQAIINTKVNQSIDTLKQRVDLHDVKIASLEQSSSKLGAKIDSVKTDLSTKIAANTSQIATINQTLGNQQYQITQNNTNLNNKTDNLQNQIWGLGNTYEVLNNKSTDVNLGSASPSNSLYPSQKAVKTYVDVTVQDAIATGAPDATTLAKGKVKLAGDLSGTADNPTVPALLNKEDHANKTSDILGNASSQVKYPTVKAIKDYVDGSVTGLAFQANLDLKANINSPVFTGTPVLPGTSQAVTQPLNNNTTSIATTEFVQSAISAGVVDANATTKGKVKLAGDLSGTADAPTVPALALKEELANKSTDIHLGTSNTLYPTQNAVKNYVDNQFANAAIPDATATAKGKIQLGGDLNGSGSSAATPIITDNAITTNKINDAAVTQNKIANGAISNAKIGEAISIANGGTGATTAPVALTNLGAEPTVNKSNDVNLGSTSPSSSLYPTQNAVKNYVDTQFTNAAIPDATTTTKGKIQLGGDLNGAGTTADAPVISDAAITTNKINDLAVTTGKIADLAVSTAKLADISVTTAKLADASVTSAKIGTAEVKTINLEDASVTAGKLANVSVETAKIANLAVTDAKINSVSGSKVTGDISGKAQNVNGIVDPINGGTGAGGTLTGYIKGNGTAAMTASATIPAADIVDAQTVSNLATATDLGAAAPSNVFYPSQLAVKTYVDSKTNAAVGTSTQTALNLKEDVANKDANVNLGTSNTAYPTQNAVKTYVDTKLGGTNAISSLTSLPNIANHTVLGNMSGAISTPQELPITGTGSVVFGTNAQITSPTITNPVLNGTISGTAVVPITNGGTGTTSLPSGYVKGGASALTTTASIPWQDVSGGVHSVNGNLADPTTGNVAIAFGMVTTGLLVNRPAVATTNNGDIYVISGETGANASDNGRTFISTGGASGTWNEVTPNQASLDARYVQLAGSTMNGNLIFPTGNKVSIADAPVNNTDAVNKDYVDSKVASATPDASTTATGKIQLAGDLTGTATSPLVADKAINFAKMQDVSSNVVLGRSASGSGNIEALTTLPVTTLPALTGDVTSTAGTAATTISNQAVTFAKIQQLSAQSLLLGTGQNGGTQVTEVSLGTGLSMVNNVLTSTGGTVTIVTGTNNRINVSNGTTTPSIDIASTYVGQSSITTLGTITTGTWNGSTIAVANGGTGVNTLTAGYVKADGTNPLTTTATIPVADVVDAETINNKSTATDLGGSSSTDAKYPSQLAVKTYVDGTVAGATPDATASVLGKIKLGGDLAGTGSSAAAPIITTGAINPDKLASNAVTTVKIADANVTTVKIADENVTTAKIAHGTIDQVLKTNAAGTAVEWGKLSSDNLLGKDLTAGDASITVTDGIGATLIHSNVKVSDLGINTAKLADNAVTSAKIVDGTILADDLANDAVETIKIKNLNVTEAKLADGAVSTIKLADLAITSNKVADNAITTVKIADANVTNAKLELDAVTSDKIKDGEVKTSDILDANVTTAKIADAGVTNAKIQDAAVTTSKIASGGNEKVLVTDNSGTVTWIDKHDFAIIADMTSIEGLGTTLNPFKVKDLGIVTSKLADNAVTTAKIADANVSNSKLDKTNIPLSGFGAAAADVALGGNKLTGVADPLSAQDAATKAYVDSNVSTINTSLNTEITRATGAESTLTSNLAAEVTRATTAENTKEDKANKSTDITLADATNTKFPTELAVKTYVDNATGALNTLANGKIYVGDASNAAAEVSMSGDVTMDNAGVTSIGTSKVVTGMIADANVTTAKIADANVSNSKLDKTNIPLSGFGAAAADVALGGNKLTGVADPIGAQDAATKAYVDSNVSTINTSLNTEITRATGAESTLTSNLAAEVTRATTAENTKEDKANKSTDITLADATNTKFPTELAVKTYVDNATGALNTLANGKIYVGDASNAAAEVSMSGDVTMDNAGVTSIGTSKVVTGMIADANVTTAKIADANVSNSKLDKTNIPLSGFGAAAADVALGGNKLTGVADPIGAQDAATKSYVDAATGALNTLANGKIYVGDASNAAAEVSMSGDVTMNNSGVTTIGASKVVTGMIADASVTNAKIAGSISITNGGTGASTAAGALSNLGAEAIINKSTDGNLHSATAASDVLYPSELAVKTYVDSKVSSSVGASTQTALNLKEDVANKSISTTLGTSDVLYPSQNAVKTYVDTKLIATNAIANLSSLPNIANNTILGNLSGASTTPQELLVTGSGNVVMANSANMTSPTIASPVLNGTITGTAIVPVAQGGSGTNMSSTAGYVKQATTGANFTTVAKIPLNDVDGAVHKVNGNGPDANGNVTIAFGEVATGILSARPTSGMTNGDIYVVSGDPTTSNNGLTYIFDGTNWNEVSVNQASLDSRYLQLAGGTMAGNITIPTTKVITLTDAPTAATDAANKAYVDTKVATATPDATTTATGKIQLAGDLSGSATSPEVGVNKITLGKMATVSSGTILGRNTTGTGNVEALTTIPTSTLPAFTGDVTTTTGSAATSISANAVSYNKIQNVSAQSKLLGSGATGGLSVTEITLGTGLSMSGSTLNALSGTVTNVTGTTDRIIVSSGTTTPSVDIASTYAGQSSITTLGTIISGTWNGTSISVANGGTGATTLTGYVKGNGTSALTASASIPVADVTGAQTSLTNSAGLAGALSDETGTGLAVFSASPALTGIPTAPTATAGTNSTQIATTAFVAASIASGVPDADATTKGKIQLAGDLAGTAASPTVPGLLTKAPLESPTFTGAPSLPTGTIAVTQSANNNSTAIATTAYVDAQTTASVANKQNTLTNSAGLAGALSDETGTGLAVFANSPTLVTPNLGTPSTLVGTNITGTAAGLTAGTVTTNADLTGEVTSVGNTTTVTNAAVIGKLVTGFTSGSGTIVATDNILQAIQKLDGNTALKAAINSPTLTGTPSAPTATAGTSTTQLATTEFVTTAVSAATIADATTSVKGKIQLAGDLAGNASAPSVVKIQGVAVSSSAPTSNQLLQYNGTSWVPVAKSSVAQMETEEFTPSAGQTSFTLTYTALGKVAMFINGVRVPKAAVSVLGLTVNYISASNNAYTLLTTDRVSFDYIY